VCEILHGRLSLRTPYQDGSTANHKCPSHPYDSCS